MSTARLEELEHRIECVAIDPASVRAPLVRLVRPILARIGWQPRVSVDAACELLSALRTASECPDDGTRADECELALTKAIEELEANVVAVERVCVVAGRAPVAHAAWLRRLWEFVSRARAAIEARVPLALRLAAGTDAVAILPPLRVREAPEGENESSSPADMGARRLLELELGAIDHLLDAARAEPEVLARRRRLLEAARQVLLETSAALPLEREGVEARRAHIAAEIARIDRLEALGLDPEVGLLHQARSALSRGDRERLHTALVALDVAALARGDAQVAERTGEALRRLWQGVGHPFDRAMVSASLERSGVEVFGERVVRAIVDAYEQGRRALPQAIRSMSPEFYALAKEYLAPGGERATLSAALAVDGCFEVGGVISPVRVTEWELRARTVRHPTQHLVLTQAQEVADLPDAIIEDPRTIILDLAAGRLLARRFVHEERRPRSRTVLVGEVRVYVLDGSGSMIGPRARMRDAILLAELATLMRRLADPRRAVRVALYYRYFTDTVGPTTRVDSESSAMAAIADVVGTLRNGGTDIEAALLASFEQVREARANDPDLARAQIVLVTDGEAPVREELVSAARESVGEVPLGVSVIALGVENRALRTLVARQRARGERAFYHFIDDAALIEICEGRAHSGPALHLPAAAPGTLASSRELAAALEREVGTLVEELAALGRARDLEAIEALEYEARAREEVGLPASALSEGERARAEALRRDRRALELRYARWFPPPARKLASEDLNVEAGTIDRDDLDAVRVALSTVAEVVGVVGGSDLSRRADAIEVLERLLPDARLSPGRYEAVLRCFPTQVADALLAVHRAVEGTKATRIEGGR